MDRDIYEEEIYCRQIKILRPWHNMSSGRANASNNVTVCCEIYQLCQNLYFVLFSLRLSSFSFISPWTEIDHKKLFFLSEIIRFKSSATFCHFMIILLVKTAGNIERANNIEFPA